MRHKVYAWKKLSGPVATPPDRAEFGAATCPASLGDVSRARSSLGELWHCTTGRLPLAAGLAASAERAGVTCPIPWPLPASVLPLPQAQPPLIPPPRPQPPPSAMGSPTGPCRVLPRGWQRPHGQSILRLLMGPGSIPCPSQIFPHPYSFMAHFGAF